MRFAATKKIQKHLKQALVLDGPMSQALYDEELVDYVAEFQQSLAADDDEYLFALVEDEGQVALLLIQHSGEVYANEEARAKLKEIWRQAYASNMNTLIPGFAQQLDEGEIPMIGVKTAHEH